MVFFDEKYVPFLSLFVLAGGIWCISGTNDVNVQKLYTTKIMEEHKIHKESFEESNEVDISNLLLDCDQIKCST